MTQLTATPTDARTTQFDRTTRLDDGPDGTYVIDLPDDWAALVGIHGGYLAAVAVRAAQRRVAEREVRTLSTSFERPARPGRAVLHVDEVRRGRSLSTVQVTLQQDDRTVIASRITMAAGQHGVEWSEPQPVDLPPPEACVPIEPRVPSPHFDRADGLLDPSSLPFTGGPKAMVRGYLRPVEPRPIDAAWLAMASDWFPPPAFVRIEPPTGGVSVDLVTHVHRTLGGLADDWLTASFEIRSSAGGLATEHGRIATVDGVLLAESIQTRWMVSG